MSKRKLTQQQQRRVQHKQQSHLQQQKALDGLVVACYGKLLRIEDSSSGELFSCYRQPNLPTIVVGDRVAWLKQNDQQGTIVALHPRSSTIQKFQAKTLTSKPIAANVDRLLLVTAITPAPQPYLIDQFLVFAEVNNLDVAILLNKIDLLDKQVNFDCIQQIKNLYQDLGYSILETSIIDLSGIGQLTKLLAHHTNIFAGQSGVGKSSLIGQLLPDLNILTGKLSMQGKLGTHATTTAQLYHLPSGGNLIDSPGIRQLGIANLTKQQIAQGYREFKNYLGKCKFKDCQHLVEPNCALQQALADGKISPLRWNNFLKISES